MARSCKHDPVAISRRAASRAAAWRARAPAARPSTNPVGTIVVGAGVQRVDAALPAIVAAEQDDSQHPISGGWHGTGRTDADSFQRRVQDQHVVPAGGCFFECLAGCFRFSYLGGLQIRARFAIPCASRTPLLATKMRPVFMHHLPNENAGQRPKTLPLSSQLNAKLELDHDADAQPWFHFCEDRGTRRRRRRRRPRCAAARIAVPDEAPIHARVVLRKAVVAAREA